MNEKPIPVEPRVVGFDAHPDSFTTARLRGATPASAVVEKLCNKVPMVRLQEWAKKNLTAQDLCVLEASGNSFQVVRTLAACGFKAKVLESCQLGKLKEAHANNDKISAVRIGKAYLAGTAKEVWIPDPVSQERRDWMHAYRKVVKRTTQLQNRVQSYLSDNGVRLDHGVGPADAPSLRLAKTWSTRQWCVLEGLLMELDHAEQQRAHWLSLMAQEVLHDPVLLSLVRLCGIRDITAFALGAVIGDIHRFAGPKKLVSYVGLHPAFDDSGENQWSGGIGGHGREDLRSLLIEAAQSILRTNHPLARWGKKLLARKGEYNLVVAAVARRLTVAVWYLLMGRETPVVDIDERMKVKVGKIISHVGKKALQTLGQSRAELRSKAYQSLKHGRVYVLDPNKKMPPRASGAASPPTQPVAGQSVPTGKVASKRPIHPLPEGPARRRAQTRAKTAGSVVARG